MTDQASSTVGSGGSTGLKDRGVVSWMLYDWAAQPFYTLITTFLFAPYFVNVFAGDPVSGQAAWGYATAAAGLIVGFTSPLLGAWADASGARKPFVALTAAVMALAMTALWWAIPEAPWAYALVITAVIIAIIAAEYGIVLTNAMMSTLVGPSQLGRLSGYGWALGYAGGLVALIAMAGFVVTDPSSGKTLLGLAPLLDLDTSTHEPERLLGPFCALWFVLFSLPFFLYTPDKAPPPAQDRSWRAGLAEIRTTFAELRNHTNIIRFLIARMLYVDGLSAIFAFGGIYGASVFGWKAFELGLFGIVLAFAGAVGPLISGRIDDRISARTVIFVSLIMLMVASVGVVSIDGDAIFWSISYDSNTSGLFASTGERVFLVFGVLLGLAAGPVQASSRSLMARLAPPDKQSQFFGLFAFSGKVTSFLAPLAIALVTDITGNQRLGIAVILFFLTAGFVLMLTVKDPKR